MSQYTFDEGAYKDLKVLVFNAYTEDWLDFILSCRREQDNSNMILLLVVLQMIKYSILLNCFLMA